ncbi:DNA-binding response regulator [Terrimonas sp.]|uniref:response regulator n=1 Tax=Terrimonas sp. TaxID=1914338 RepID=UPI000D52443D|nr:response regulator transcription factor [Terrimonas sp.]PVD52981.1 DNA-binding response regulator [Terrimonas sp.]
MNSILIVDDHSVVRAGIMYLFSQESASLEIDEAKDGNNALALLKNKAYSLVILDVNIPGTDTVGFIEYMLTVYPGTKILVFTMNSEEGYGKRFLQMGVKGFLNKESPDEEIRKAVWTVLKGNRYISNNLAQLLSAEALDRKKENPFDELSKREFEVVLQLIKGDSVSLIAETMSLHASTIGTHKANIFQKLRVHNIIQLTDLAKLYGIIA